MKKKVSIVVPVYNAGKYVATCIESLINQTYKDLEILLINDGSTDNSIKILRNYQQKDNRIVIIDRENKGSIYSRLEGMQKSVGEYVMFVDADDWLELDSVEKTVQVAEKYNADIVRFYSIREQVEEGIKIKMDGPYNKEKYIPKDQFKNYLYPIIINTYGCNTIWGQLVKKEATKNIKIKNDHVKMGDDLLINLEIYKNINSIVFTNNHFYHYRKTENSITNTANLEKIKNNIKDTYETYSKFYEMLKIWNIDTEENRNLVSKRIIDELLTILKSVFVNKMSKEQKLEVIKETRNLLNNDIQINKHSLNKIEKMFLEKKYNDIINYTTVKIKIPYLIKKQMKKVLRCINKVGGNIE